MYFCENLEPIACCRAYNAYCNACSARQEVEGYCRNNPRVLDCHKYNE